MSVDSAAAETTKATAATRMGIEEGDGEGDEQDRPRAGALAVEDLHGLARRATAARRATLGDRASFVRARQLLATGTWRGPRDAIESYVEEDDLPALGGWTAARALGASLLVGGRDPALHAAAYAGGARSLWRLSFRGGEDRPARDARLAALRTLLAGGLRLWGVMPTPDAGREAEGLDTLHLVATCRLAFPAVPHVVADVPAFGPRLAQMCLGFGADELFGPIVSERALRLGDNARNPAMTRKEAAILIRGAGLTPCERVSDLRLEEVTT
jgi:hypothetical protein